MKKKVSIIALVIALVLVLLTAFSYATEIQPRTVTADDVITISEGEAVTTNEDGTTEEGSIEDNVEDEIIYDDVYLFEDSDYEMDKLIDGNLFLMVDGDLKFTGAVKGSVYLLVNGSVEFTEDVYIADSLYILSSENIKINGEMYDIYSFSDNFEIGENSYIWRDVRAVANAMKLRGIIYRNVHLNSETIDVQDESTELLIGGNFNYTSPQEIEGLNEIVQYGEVKFSLQEDNEEVVVEETLVEKIMNFVWGSLSSAVYVLVVYGVLKLIAPKFIEKNGKDLREKGIVAFAIGILAWVIISIVIVITIIMIFTSLGAPVAVIAWILMLVGIYISPAVFTIALVKIFKKENVNVGAEIVILVVTAVAIWLLQQVPYLGGFISLVVVTTGLGLVIRNACVKKEEKVEKIENVVESSIQEENKVQEEVTEENKEDVAQEKEEKKDEKSDDEIKPEE